jgi:hypothetical protein
MIILSIIGYILLFILVVILALIFIPYSYFLEINKKDELNIGGVVSWLFGGLKVDFRVTDWKLKSAKLSMLGFQKNMNMDKLETDTTKKKSSKDEVSENDKEEKKKVKKSVKLEYFKKEIISKLMEVIKKAWRHIRPHRINARIEAGFDNPMYTGFLCGIFTQTWVLDERYDIRFQPSFQEEVLSGKGFIEGRIWIPYLLAIAIKFIFAKPVRKMVFSKQRKV